MRDDRLSATPSATKSIAGYNLRGLQGEVINTLGQRIVSGKYEVGRPLPAEAALMEEFGVSRTSLREAIKVLAAKGLVESRQRVGTIVRAKELWNVFDGDVIIWYHHEGKAEKIFKDLVEMRLIIEPKAAMLAATRAGMPVLQRIEKAARDMAAAVSDPAAYCEADVEFHFAVIAASDNLLITSFANVVGDFMRLSFELQQNALNDSDNLFKDDAAGHAAVYDAICRGDGPAAETAMHAVVMHGKRSLISAMAEMQ